MRSAHSCTPPEPNSLIACCSRCLLGISPDYLLSHSYPLPLIIMLEYVSFLVSAQLWLALAFLSVPFAPFVHIETEAQPCTPTTCQGRFLPHTRENGEKCAVWL
jgi:hypothetical protein